MEKLTLPATMDNFDTMMKFIRQGAGTIGFEDKTINRISLAFEEAVVNVIKYAYPDNDGTIEITYDFVKDRKGLIIEIIDHGMSFNPLAKPEPDINAPVEERPIGGLGIFMVKIIMDEVNYKRDLDRNILTMTKYL